MKFTFNVKTAAVPGDGSKAAQTIVTDPEAAGPNFLVPGRYTVLDTGLYCEPAIMSNTDLTFNSFGPS